MTLFGFHNTATRRLAFCLPLLMTVNSVMFSAAAFSADEKPHDFDRWEKAIVAFERADAKTAPPKHGLLFVGSSSIRGWKLPNSFPKRQPINRGFGGSQIVDSTHFADRIILKHKPRTIVLYAGDNDIAKGKSPKRVAADFQNFVKTIHAELPKSRILFIAIKPSLKRWKLADKMKRANALVAAQCREDDRIVYIDIVTPMLGDDGKPRGDLFLKDGLHLNAKGYALWTKVLNPHLK